MSDRDLLKNAAKAAGIWGVWQFVRGQDTLTPICYRAADGRVWNPLTDSGQALELAVKLAVLIGTFKFLRLLVSCLRQEKGGHNDPYAATRRAIVRAASEIGRGKE